MTEAKIQNAIASCVVGLTRHLMAKSGKPDYEAYRCVTDSKLYQLLLDTRTNLYLDTNAELCNLLDIEEQQGDAALYAALND